MVLKEIGILLDSIFWPVTIMQPYLSIFIISAFLTTLIITLNRILLNKELIKEIKHKMEQIREKLSKAQREGNREEIQKFLNEMMKINSIYLRQTFKTFLISLIIISIFLPFLSYKYEGLFVASLPFTLPFIGNKLQWIYWYVLVSFTIGWILKKILEV